jgi:hypothetical protein
MHLSTCGRWAARALLPLPVWFDALIVSQFISNSAAKGIGRSAATRKCTPNGDFGFGGGDATMFMDVRMAATPTAANSVQRPTWLNSYLFFAAYLKGDLGTASQYANLDASETHPLNLLTRTPLAARNGDQGKAKQIMDPLKSLYPKWRDSPRRELQKFYSIDGHRRPPDA